MDCDGISLRALRDIGCCVYCGDVSGLQRDHVIPTSYKRDKRRFEGDWLVPACGECNRTLGAELIFNVPDRAYWILQVYQRKYQRVLRSIPWHEDELEDLGHSMRTAIVEHEKARARLQDRLQHLKVTAAQPITYLAPLRPAIDPEIEDVPEFRDEDLYRRQEQRLDLLGKARRRFKVKEMD